MTSDPATYEEYLARFASNQQITGFGVTTRISVPWPFCAAAGFMQYDVLEVERVMAAGSVCRACGRGAKAIFQWEGKSVQFEIVQTGGEAPPAWLPAMRRMEAE